MSHFVVLVIGDNVADDPKLTAVICTRLEAIRARLRQRRATV